MRQQAATQERNHLKSVAKKISWRDKRKRKWV